MIYTINSLTELHGVYLDNITIKEKNTLIDYYLNFSDTDDSCYVYQDHNEKTLAVLNVNRELTPKILSKGVFETFDEITNQKVSIQFYKTTPLLLTEDSHNA